MCHLPVNLSHDSLPSLNEEKEGFPRAILNGQATSQDDFLFSSDAAN